jgi:hypothetical protein
MVPEFVCSQVLPTKKFINFTTTMLDRKLLDNWPEDDVNCFKKYVLEAKTVYFEQVHDIVDPDIVFGDLFLEMKNGGTVELSRLLCQHGSAHRYPTLKFMSMMNRTAIPLIERWNNNSQSGGVLNHPDLVIFPKLDYDPEITPSIDRREEEQQKEIALSYDFKLEIERSIQKVHGWQHHNSQYDPAEPIEDNFPYDLPKYSYLDDYQFKMAEQSRRRSNSGHSSDSSYYNVKKKQASCSGYQAPNQFQMSTPIEEQQFFRSFLENIPDTKKTANSNFVVPSKPYSNM